MTVRGEGFGEWLKREEGQERQTSRHKISKSWEYNVQHGDYNDIVSYIM